MTANHRTDPQRSTDALFGDVAAYWRDVYEQEGVQGLVYRRRMETVLAWVDALSLPAGARVLEVGCGAGLISVELARRGLTVDSTDSSSGMVEVARQRIADSDEKVDVRIADVHDLPHDTASYALVVAIGVLPWLHTPSRAVAELARVLGPGGHAIVTADNRKRLNRLVEPVEHPLLAPARQVVRAVRRRRGRSVPDAVSHQHRPAEVDRMLLTSGIDPMRRRTVGFGPFTFLRRRVLPERPAVVVDARLQQLADRGVPGLRGAGWHYVVCGRRR